MTSKIMISWILMFLLNNTVVVAQSDTTKIKREYVAYTFFYNVVPNQFNYPLIGFVNIGKGNHKGVQMGFVNTTIGSFSGAQIGFVNTTLKNTNGLQLGFVNTTLKNFSGTQVGFINTTLKNTTGLQLGFVNTTLGNFSGAQVGFVNTTTQNTSGLQLSFVNIASKGIKGSQIGFVNVADTISGGIPFGFFSVVKKGGYRAIDVSLNELYPFNMVFKTGVTEFYSFVQGSYNYDYSNPFAIGLGLGSLIPIGTNFYFNPEIGTLSSISSNNNSMTTALVTNIRYRINSRFQIAAGPSIVWLNYPAGENMYDSPWFSLFNEEINARNRLLSGLRVALSFNFTEL